MLCLLKTKAKTMLGYIYPNLRSRACPHSIFPYSAHPLKINIINIPTFNFSYHLNTSPPACTVNY